MFSFIQGLLPDTNEKVIINVQQNCCYSLLDELPLMQWILCQSRATVCFIDEPVVDFSPEEVLTPELDGG